MTLFIIFLIIILSILAVYVYFESIGFTVVDYVIKDKRIRKDFKFVYLSDLHNKEHGDLNDKLVKEIENLNPDFVVFGGDMVTSCMEKSYDFSRTLLFIENLSKKYKIYYGIGNHEAKFRDKDEEFRVKYVELVDFLNKINVPLLIDSKDYLSEYGVNIYCADIEKKYYRRFITREIPDDYLENKLGKIDKEQYSILIAHNPEHFKKYSNWGADLVLSGHVHGGVVGVPFLGGLISPSFKIFPKYDAGKFVEGKSTMILTRGIGSHTIPIRVNNKAEIVLISIKGE